MMANETFSEMCINHQSCATALANAVSPVIRNAKYIDEKINLYFAYKAINQINEKNEEGKHIAGIRVCIGNVNYTIDHQRECSNLWRDFFNFYRIRVSPPADIENEIKKLKRIRKKLPHIITLRISMVFVKYGIFK